MQKFPTGFRLLAARAISTSVHREVESAIAAVLGGNSRVNAFRRKFIAPAARGKFALLKPLAR